MNCLFDFIEKRLLSLIAWPAMLALFVMMMVTIIDIVGRSLLNLPIRGSVEITEMALAIMIVFIFPLVVWQETHISVDLLDNVIPRWIVSWRQLFIHASAAIVLFFLSKQLFKYAGRAISYGDVTEFLRIPKGYIFYAMSAMGFVSMGVSALLSIKYALVIVRPQFNEQEIRHD